MLDAINTLSNGYHPITEEKFDESSILSDPKTQEILAAIALELNPSKPRRKVSVEQRVEINKRKKRPVKSHCPWSDDDDMKLKKFYDEGVSYKHIAQNIGRSEYAVVIRLRKLNCISLSEVAKYSR